MVLPQRGDVLHREGFVALLQPFENLLQGIRGLTHCRYDDEQILFVTDDLQQVLHTVRVADRCAAELVNFHRSIKQYVCRPVLRRAGFRTRIGIGPAASEAPFSAELRTCDRNSIISFRPSCKACPYSGKGTRIRQQPPRCASRRVCRRRGPPWCRCGSGSERRRPGRAAFRRRI